MSYLSEHLELATTMMAGLGLAYASFRIILNEMALDDRESAEEYQARMAEAYNEGVGGQAQTRLPYDLTSPFMSW